MDIRFEYGNIMGGNMQTCEWFSHEFYIIIMINMCCAVVGILCYCQEVSLSNKS